MATNYTTKTAALKATKADINKIDAKKMLLNGKNILEYIEDAIPTVKHAQDTRTTVKEDDRWGQWIETKSDGTIVIHDDWVTNPDASSGSAWNTLITKVEDNKAYTSSGFYANIQTERIKDGNRMFYTSNLASFNGDLSNLTNGYDMFRGCNNLTSFTSDDSGSPVNLSSLSIGSYMFLSCSNLTSFSSDLSNLTDGVEMFSHCSNLESFTSALPSLIRGSSMFSTCDKLTSFTSDLPSLTNGGAMFQNCSQLTSITSNLSSLRDGSSMFYHCTALTSFTSALPSLIRGSSMFSTCDKLISFSSDLSSLSDGSSMFDRCSQLTSFSSDLSSLTNGEKMFDNCSLDAESVMYIADTIKDIATEEQLYVNGTIPYVTHDIKTHTYSATRGFMENGEYVYTYNNPQPHTTTIPSSYVGKLTLGINVSNNADTIKQQLEDFAKEATFDTWSALKTHFSNKGWTVTFQYGGDTTSIPNTYDLRNGEQIIPCPIFAKLIEADKDSAQYCTEDASSFYNIEWGHDVTDTSSYTQFNSLEDAMAHWNVFPKENIITTEEED